MEIEKRPWLHLLTIIGLPRKDDLKSSISDEESADAFNKVVDGLLKLPKLDVVRTLVCYYYLISLLGGLISHFTFC